MNLFDLTETSNLADIKPARLRELIQNWEEWKQGEINWQMTRYQVCGELIGLNSMKS